MGTMTGPGEFLNLSDTTGIVFTDPALHLNLSRRQLELHFNCAIDGGKFNMFRLILPLRFLIPDSLLLNRERPSTDQYMLVFETSVAPQLWRKSDEVDDQDLKERLFWSENEQWIRDCDIGGERRVQNQKSTEIISNSTLLPLGRSLHTMD